MSWFRKGAWRAGWRSGSSTTMRRRGGNVRSQAEVSRFDKNVVLPIHELLVSIWPGQVRRNPLLGGFAGSLPVSPDEMRERIGRLRGLSLRGVSSDDAKKLLNMSLRILRRLGGYEAVPQVCRLRAATKRLRGIIPVKRYRHGGVSCACPSRVSYDKAAADVLNGITDALVIVIPKPKGSGLKIHVVSEDDDNQARRRGPGRGGLIIRTGIANCPYRIHPDHETIEFCPDREKEGRKYLIRRTQEAAVKIVNRLTGGMESGKDDWFVPFTSLDASVMRSANAEFLADCIEREKLKPTERRGHQKWTDRARLRRELKPEQKTS